MEHLWVVLAEMAADRGGRALVAFPRVTELSSRISSAPIEVVEQAVPDESPEGWTATASLLRRERVRTVYLTDRAYFSLLYPVFRACGVDSIIVHDHTPGERPSVRGPRRFAKQLIHGLRILSADLYIGVSQFVYRRFLDNGALPASRCTYVHNGIPCPKLRGDRDIRRVVGLAKDSRIIVSNSRVHPYKGIDFLIACAESLVSTGSHPNVHFVHFGHGPYMATARARVEARGLSDRFHFVGYRDDVRELLPSCDVALHASKGEAFSLALLEFMEAGLATIAPDHCGNPEAIHHGVHGLLYPPGDLKGVVNWLAALLDDPIRTTALGEAARTRVRTRFTLEAMDERFRDAVGRSLVV